MYDVVQIVKKSRRSVVLGLLNETYKNTITNAYRNTTDYQMCFTRSKIPTVPYFTTIDLFCCKARCLEENFICISPSIFIFVFDIGSFMKKVVGYTNLV